MLQRGGGPDVAFRAYLLTAVRRLQVDRIRATARLTTTDDMEAFDPGVPFVDTAVEGFESAAAARAFASLPERWQLVLWHTEVEGDKPADIAPILGMSANSVSALAYRAREGLREAFLTQHAAELEADTCRWTHGQLGAYVRGSSSRRDGAKVKAAPRRVPPVHGGLPRAQRGQLQPRRRPGAAAPRRGGHRLPRHGRCRRLRPGRPLVPRRPGP